MNLKLFTLIISLSACFQVSAQITADFTGTNTSDCSPLIVSFSDASSGSPTSWLWNFGNGNTSTQQHPSAVYTIPGIYTVTLIASNGSSSDTSTKVNFVEVYSKPVPDFTSDVVIGCVPLNVTFSNLTTTGSIGIETYTWDFGDGNFSNDVSPSHTYAVPGNYNVILIAVDSNGCQDQITKPGYISISNAPAADFSSINNNGCSVPQTVAFSNLSSGSSGLTYEWYFGDGDSSSAPNPSHTYTAFGNYDVMLIAHDAFGCSDTILKPAHAVFNNVVPDFSANMTNSCVGVPINFTDLTTPGALNPKTWLWDFGDGNTSTLQNPTHSYMTAGTYTVSLQAIFSGCSQTETKTNFITIDPSPSANFSSSSTSSCTVPLSVNFTDLSLGATSWVWDFGDGNTSVLQNPSHTYTSYGQYDVSLIITSVSGCQDTMTIPGAIQVLEPQALVGSVITNGCLPLTVNFMDSSISAQPITSWYWDFGDGNSSTAQNPTHVYNTQGDFTVTLAIENSAGCSDTIILVDAVETGTTPIVDFVASPTSTCLYMNISFTNLTADGTAWYWDFGDGGSMMVENPSYQYSDTGYFSVTLTVTNNGCTADSTFTDYVYVSPPDALFSPTYSCSNTYEVTFNDMSISPDIWIWDFGTGDSSFVPSPVYVFPDTGTYVVSLYVEDTVTGCADVETQNIVITYPVPDFIADNNFGCRAHTVNFSDLSEDAIAWDWNFEGGDTSSLQNPTVTYNASGVYDVSLTITDIHGCTKTKIFNDYIIVTGPVAGFDANVKTGCAPLTVDFTDLSTEFVGNITSWSWFFGDGNTSSLQNPSNTYMNSGNFAVSLVVTDDLGCTHTNTQSNYIRTTFPDIDFIVDTFTCPGSPLSFMNLSSGSALTYIWDFGDGNTSSLTDPTHTYANEGQYDITLIATDASGCADTLVRPAHVSVELPVADFTADSIFSSCPPLFADFSDLSTGDVVSWLWDFGDGSSSTVQNPSKIYTAPGQFNVTLIVTSREGCMDTITKINYAEVLGPDGVFTFDPPTGCINLPVTFSAVTNNSVSNVWDFGDGTVIKAEDTVLHIYTTTGNYFPTLILTDISGCIFIVNSQDSILAGGQTIDFTASPNHVCIPNSVNFTDLTVAYPAVTSWEWDFGDGAGSNIQNPSHVYNTPGNFDVTLVTDNGICRDTLTQYKFIDADPGPAADFSMSDSAGCVPLLVNFTNLTLSDSAIAGVSWNFGDGNLSLVSNPTHTFNTVGTFSVELIVLSVAGCSDTIRKTVTVNGLPVVATSPDTSFCEGDSIEIFASGGIAYEWTPAASLSNSGISNPVATPVLNTTYSVQVTDANGCINFDSVAIIVNPALVLDAGPDQTICQGDTVPLSGMANGISYKWSPPAGLSADSILNPLASPVVSTNYILTTIDTNGCAGNDAMTVTVNMLPPVSAGNDTFICGGNNMQLNALGAATYTWSPATFLDNPFISNPLASPLTNITYIINGTGTNGCTANDTLSIRFVQPPDVNAGNDQTICLGDSVQLISSGGDPTDSYDWSPSTGISNTTVADPFAFPTATTFYTLTITDSLGCFRSDFVTVNVNALPDIILSSAASICLGDTATISASGGINYSWATSPFLGCTNCPNPSAYPPVTTQFNVDVTDTNGCVNTDSITLTVHTLPIGILNNDTSICINESVRMATGTGVTHSWSPAAGLSCTNCPDPLASPTDTTTYFVTITSSFGCVTYDSIVVNIVPLPVTTVSPDATICEGGNAQINATGGVSYNWTPATGLSCTNCDTTIAMPSATTAYSVAIGNSFGCISTESINVFVQPVPVVDAGPDITACPGENVQINGLSDASSNYWIPTIWLNNPMIVDPVATPIDTTTFILTSTNLYGCSASDTMVLNVIDKVSAAVSSDTAICVGESVRLNASVLSGSDAGSSVVWRPGFYLDNANSANPLSTPQQDITYSLIAYSSTCTPDTQQVSIDVNPLPLVDAGINEVIAAGSIVTLSASSNSNNTFSWSPEENLTCANCQNTDVVLTESEMFKVTVTDQNGCSASDSVLFTVFGDCGENLLFIPNVFTPNNDNLNDIARVRTIGIHEINFYRIFDRWGKLIFETNDINEGWDGTLNGKKASSGVYVYYISVTCTDNVEITKQGNITLMR